MRSHVLSGTRYAPRANPATTTAMAAILCGLGRRNAMNGSIVSATSAETRPPREPVKMSAVRHNASCVQSNDVMMEPFRRASKYKVIGMLSASINPRSFALTPSTVKRESCHWVSPSEADASDDVYPALKLIRVLIERTHVPKT